jgi:hypothetical protein
MADELRGDRSKPKLAAAVTLYHIVVEASLAQPGQHMIESYLEEYDVLPASARGCATSPSTSSATSASASSCWPTSTAEDPEPIQEAIVETIREALPWTAAVAKPPNWNRRYTECFGFTLEDIGEAGATSLEQKLRAVGLPVDRLPRFPMPMDVPARERAIRGQTMLRANLLGPERPAVKDPDAVAFAFDGLRRQADATKVRPGTTLQWDFTDYEPWQVVLDRRAPRPSRGAPPRPT